MSDTSTNSEQKPGPLSTALKWLSIPATAAAGYFFGSTHVSNAAYNRAKKHNLIGRTPDTKIDPVTKLEVAADAPGFILKTADKVRVVHKEARVELLEKGATDIGKVVAPLDKISQQEVREGMKSIGLGNIFKQWNYIHLSDKQEALMKGFTAAGITIGALLSIANSKTIANALSRKDAEKDKQIS